MNVHILLIFIVALVAIIGIVSVKYLGADNPIEKVAEQVILEETGINVKLDERTIEVQTPAPQSTSLGRPPSGNTKH